MIAKISKLFMAFITLGMLSFTPSVLGGQGATVTDTIEPLAFFDWIDNDGGGPHTNLLIGFGATFYDICSGGTTQDVEAHTIVKPLPGKSEVVIKSVNSIEGEDIIVEMYEWPVTCEEVIDGKLPVYKGKVVYTGHGNNYFFSGDLVNNAFGLSAHGRVKDQQGKEYKAEIMRNATYDTDSGTPIVVKELINLIPVRGKN